MMKPRYRLLGLPLVLAVGIGIIAFRQPEADSWIPRLLLAGGALTLAGLAWWRWRQRARARFLAGFRFPVGLVRKVRERYPHLSDTQAEMVVRELRTFFQVALAAQGQMVSKIGRAHV